MKKKKKFPLWALTPGPPHTPQLINRIAIFKTDCQEMCNVNQLATQV